MKESPEKCSELWDKTKKEVLPMMQLSNLDHFPHAGRLANFDPRILGEFIETLEDIVDQIRKKY